MNVIVKDGVLRFDSTNDLSYVLQQIPVQLKYRKATLPPSTKVEVSVHVDGIYAKKFDPPVEYGDREKLLKTLRKILGVSSEELELNSVRPAENSISARLKIELKYPSLGECSSDAIISVLGAKLKTVQEAGLSIREPQPVDD